MKEILVAMWSTILVRGIVSVAFGLFAIFWPAQFLQFLALAFGAYALIDGLLTIWSALSPKAEGRNRVLLLVNGVVSAVVGLAALIIPGQIAVYLILLIGLWNIAMGILQLVAAIVLRKELEGEIWLAISAIVSILFGVAIVANWAWGVMAVALLVGLAALVVGVILIAFAWRLRGIGNELLARGQ
jgi:uncharacterized membrane protein HdeD (DUF308 family)